ncbi:MAG TPA: polymorphic toxin-type HINT domain-containing protein [Anaerolineaceae bacterium]|nr:polymorphic toxin-type HINT domain-containing protein [Anaerolineaceae bacterium]
MTHCFHIPFKQLNIWTVFLVHVVVILSLVLSTAVPVTTVAAYSDAAPKDPAVSVKTDLSAEKMTAVEKNETNEILKLSALTNTALTPVYYYAMEQKEVGAVGTPLAGFRCQGNVSWPISGYSVGVPDGAFSKLINSSHYNSNNGAGFRACMVVSLGKSVYLNNSEVQAYVRQPQTITQDMGMEIAVSTSATSCNESGWTLAAGYQEVGGYNGENWYGGKYTGDVKYIRIQVWSNGGNLFCKAREFYIDSVRVKGLPSLLVDRSALSSNAPKNGAGDSRECAINGCANAQATAGDPIDTRSGNFDYSLVDLALPTLAGPLTLQRSYASLATDTTLFPTALGPGWTHNQDVKLIIDNGVAWFKGHTLNQYQFKQNGEQGFSQNDGVLASLTHQTDPGMYFLTSSDKSIYTFDASGNLLTWRNALGYGFDYAYSDGMLSQVTEPVSGRYLQYHYQDGRLAWVNDHTGRQVSYGYDANGDLVSFTDVRGLTWAYEYDGISHHLQTLKDPSSPPQTLLTVHYDNLGRADEQFNGSGERIVKLNYLATGTVLLDGLDRQAVDGYDERKTNTYRIDSAGYATQKTFDANFHVAQIKDQNNRISQFTWSADGANLLAIKDAAGYETRMTYDSQNHLVRVVDPRSQVMTFTYDGPLMTSNARQSASLGTITTTYTYTTTDDAPQPAGLLKTTTDALGHTATLTYDASGQLTMMTDAAGNQTSLVYDDLGRTTDIINPAGLVTHYLYDPAGNATHVIENFDPARPQNSENQYNLTSEFVYDAQGRIIAATNTMGVTTSYIYDDAGRIAQTVDAYGKATTYAYNAAGQVVSVTDPMNQTVSYEYDGAGRLWKVRDALDQVVITYAYNADSTLASVTRPAAGGDYVVTYSSYDGLQRARHVADNAGHVSDVTYDAYGNLLTSTDARGVVTRYEYNDLGLLSAVVQNAKTSPGGGDDPNATNVRTEYTYDKLGNLKQIRDANNHLTTFDYDSFNRLWKVTNPLGKVIEFGYDALGNRSWVKDAKDNTTSYIYDAASRLATVDYPDGMMDVNLAYDALGRLTGMDDSLGHTAWAYDDLGRITAITDPFNRTVSYGYNDNSQRTSLTYPEPVNKTLTYQYNSLGELEHVLDGPTYLADYSYTISGQLSSAALENGVNASYGYDLAGQLTALNYTRGETTLASYQYQYDAGGNRTQVLESVSMPDLEPTPVATPTAVPTVTPEPTSTPTETMGDAPLGDVSQKSLASLQDKSEISGGKALARAFVEVFDACCAKINLARLSWTPAKVRAALTSRPAGDLMSRQIDYTYDPLNRLTLVTYSDGITYAYTYDMTGNRTAQTVNGLTTLYQYDAADRLISAGGIAYTWDDNGNLLSDGAATYTYDFANRLVAASDPTSLFTYAYDGSGNRYQQSTNGELITYTLDLAGGLSEVLYDGSTVYSYGLERLAQQVNGGGREYFLSDALGSVRQLTDAGGAVIYGQSFDPFGSPIAQVGTGGSAYGYAGQWTDLSGLQYLRARYYAPGQGRFLSRDPFAGFLSQPATLNPYVYAANNPVLMSDPSGEIAPLLALAGAGLLGGTMAMGFDILAQLYTIQPTSIDQIIHCMNWGEVGISFAAGTVAGLAGVVGFEAMTAIFGTGLLGMVAGGAFAGILSGQYDILTRLVLTGQISQAGNALLRPEDIIGTGLVGGGLAGIGYGISRVAGLISSPCSFSADTPVATEEGEKPIEEVEVGDRVLAYDEGARSTGYYTVIDKLAHEDQQLVNLVIDGEEIETTPEHPFYTMEEGWVPAGSLWMGAHILQADGTNGIIQEISFISSHAVMYNLSVDQAHTFFVGDGQWLVHNKCAVQMYEVGTYRNLKSRTMPNQEVDAHHAPQFHPAKQVFPNYQYKDGPAIILPVREHRLVNAANIRGQYLVI